jgi:hypothetical protein
VEQSEILPELYATPWFITLFARKLSLDLVYLLWDIYLVEDDPFLHYFVALALLIRNRHVLLKVDCDSLPVAMNHLPIEDIAQLVAHVRPGAACQF